MCGRVAVMRVRDTGEIFESWGASDALQEPL